MSDRSALRPPPSECWSFGGSVRDCAGAVAGGGGGGGAGGGGGGGGTGIALRTLVG